MAAIESHRGAQRLCELSPELSFKGHSFCFTGRGERMKRPGMAEAVVFLGGQVHPYVTVKTDYLVVCGDNARFKYGVLGEKIARALRLNERGAKVRLIAEEDFWEGMG